jgi:hypothetical protein
MEWEKWLPLAIAVVVALFGTGAGAELVKWLKRRFDGSEGRSKLMEHLSALKEVKGDPELEEPIRREIKAMLGIQEPPIGAERTHSEPAAKVKRSLEEVDRAASKLQTSQCLLLIITAVVIGIGYVSGHSIYTHTFLGIIAVFVSLFALFALKVLKVVIRLLNESIGDADSAMNAAEEALGQAKQLGTYADLYADFIESKGQLAEARDFAKTWEPKPEVGEAVIDVKAEQTDGKKG